MTRTICGLLAAMFVVALIFHIVTSWTTVPIRFLDALTGAAVALAGAYVFGLYAIKGGAVSETGVLSKPSEKVKRLALQPHSKIEAIKAYREQTGVDLKRAQAVVDRLTALDRSGA